MADEKDTTPALAAYYVDVLLDELERLIEAARPILMTDQVRLDGRQAQSLVQSIKDALADERTEAGAEE